MCRLCGQSHTTGVAAHDCPHGVACRYATDEALNVIRWAPECDRCHVALIQRQKQRRVEIDAKQARRDEAQRTRRAARKGD